MSCRGAASLIISTSRSLSPIASASIAAARPTLSVCECVSVSRRSAAAASLYTVASSDP